MESKEITKDTEPIQESNIPKQENAPKQANPPKQEENVPKQERQAPSPEKPKVMEEPQKAIQYSPPSSGETESEKIPPSAPIEEEKYDEEIIIHSGI